MLRGLFMMSESLIDEEPSLRSIAMPADTNPSGDIFGGWLVGQMDLAGMNLAVRIAHGRVTTAAIDKMSFHRPVYVGDEVSCYTELQAVGRCSMKIRVETYVRRREGSDTINVTEGIFTYVALDENGDPRPVDRDQ